MCRPRGLTATCVHAVTVAALIIAAGAVAHGLYRPSLPSRGSINQTTVGAICHGMMNIVDEICQSSFSADSTSISWQQCKQ